MKVILLWLFFFCICLTSNAQFKLMGEGPVFKEPEDGYAKLLQLKNGNTVFFLRLDKEITLHIYNASYQKKAEQIVRPNSGQKGFGIEALFELNNDIVLLIRTNEDRTPILYRYILDGTSGVLKSTEKIAELDRVGRGQAYGIAMGSVPIPDFFVRKDPDGDSYAVALMNSLESDRNKRIEIIWYGADNKEVGRAYYISPEEKYKYLEYLDMIVVHQQRVSILAYAYNTKISGKNEKVLALADLETGHSTVTVSELPVAKNLLITNAVARYNPVTKKMIAVIATKENKNTDEYTSYIACIDPALKEVEYAHTAYPTKASIKKMELFGRKHPFTGLPQNLYMNNDGTFSVVYEEIKSSSKYTGTELGDIAVSNYNATGKELNSCFIPKRHTMLMTYISPFYLSYSEGHFTVLNRGNQYKYFSYLNGGEKTYILFNDIEENADKAKKGKITTIVSVKECDALYYNISGYKALPDRDFVFEKPVKRQNNLALFDIADYNKEKNMYVTLKLEKEGRDKGVRLVWLQPQ